MFNRFQISKIYLFFFFLLVALAENQHMACHTQTVGRRQEAISHGMQYQRQISRLS